MPQFLNASRRMPLLESGLYFLDPFVSGSHLISVHGMQEFRILLVKDFRKMFLYPVLLDVQCWVVCSRVFSRMEKCAQQIIQSLKFAHAVRALNLDLTALSSLYLAVICPAWELHVELQDMQPGGCRLHSTIDFLVFVMRAFFWAPVSDTGAGSGRVARS